MAFSIGGTNQSTLFKDKLKTWNNLSTQYHSLSTKDIINASGTHTGNFRTLRDITNTEPEKVALEFMQMNQELATREINCLKWEMSHLKN